jgi:tRNA-2-methylthio-N6-dimethylallyladenosine synthase
MKRFFLETYGCQMNVAESNALTLQLEAEGWEAAARAEEADLVLLNTCAVRQSAEERIWGRIGYYKYMKESRDFLLVVTGCMAERLGEEIRRKSGTVDHILGTFEKERLSELISGKQKAGAAEAEREGFRFEPLHLAKGEFKAFLPVMHGCNNFCTYCIVPYVRGREISRDPSDIFLEMGKLEEAGVKEVTLLGQNVNSYYSSPDTGFPKLLEQLAGMAESVRWIRFMSSHPKDVPDELIRVIGENEAVCKHIHLPVQHGSDSVLERMNRKYSRGDYLALIEKMHRKIPDLSLSTDIMIGFPGETEDDFKATLELVRIVGFDDAFTYYYNPREGTAAFSMEEQLPRELKLERLNRLIGVQREVSAQNRAKRTGSTETVLVEQRAKKRKEDLLARTGRNEMVVFPGKSSLIGTFVRVTLKSVNGNTFRGEAVCPGE